MSKEPHITARDLMAELENDAEFRRHREEREEKRRKLEAYYANLDRPLLDKLTAKGFRLESLDELVKQDVLLPDDVVELLLATLDSCDDRRQCEMLVRALTMAKNAFDGRPLTRCYDRVRDDEGVRWIILAAIAKLKPHSIEGWLETAAKNPYLRSSLERLGHEW